ncbi:hypothetical protein PSHT_15931 [Puccinia striiformis]|uniref:Uncharacterized protein n=1 Tax=Puccinia striiformis TaxID=27350 RepID=A0A2S4UCC6_9BASI|nr:hypothetical protein PSHT_15931 [Puccinia striiformis]
MIYNEKGNRNENRTKKVRNKPRTETKKETSERAIDKMVPDHGIPDQIRHHSMSLSCDHN